MTKEKEFRKEMESILNRFSIDSHMNTPDYVLAEYLIRCLYAYESTLKYEME